MREINILKDQIRIRDGSRCVRCGTTAEEVAAKHGWAEVSKLDVHRKDAASAYTDDNCETLCIDCHQSIEKRAVVDTPLRRLRVAAGLSRQELAARAGISAVTLGMFERHQPYGPTRRNTLQRIADALGVTVDRLGLLEVYSCADELAAEGELFMSMGRNLIPTFPARLRELRESRNLDRAELAKMAGTSEHSIAKLEIGARSPSLELASRLAKALKCLVDDLLQPARKNPK